jgi:hypothetical protein
MLAGELPPREERQMERDGSETEEKISRVFYHEALRLAVEAVKARGAERPVKEAGQPRVRIKTGTASGKWTHKRSKAKKAGRQ